MSDSKKQDRSKSDSAKIDIRKLTEQKSRDSVTPPIPAISDTRPVPQPEKKHPKVDVDKIKKRKGNIDVEIVRQPAIGDTRPPPRSHGIQDVDVGRQTKIGDSRLPPSPGRNSKPEK